MLKLTDPDGKDCSRYSLSYWLDEWILRVSVTMKKQTNKHGKNHDPKQLRKERVCISFHALITIFHEGELEQELEPRPWRNTAYWISHSWLSQPAFLDYSRPPSQEVHLPQWARPSHINHQSSARPTDLSRCQAYGRIFSMNIPSSQMMLCCVKLT